MQNHVCGNPNNNFPKYLCQRASEAHSFRKTRMSFSHTTAFPTKQKSVSELFTWRKGYPIRTLGIRAELSITSNFFLLLHKHIMRFWDYNIKFITFSEYHDKKTGFGCLVESTKSVTNM